MMKPFVHQSFRRLLLITCALVFTYMLPAIALASSSPSKEEDAILDARLENYPQKMLIDTGSSALTWFLLVLLAAFCIGVLFKNARRTHLD